jgi:2-succinyl-6-hydroxy-2,4-cyclohexadiene-1-carboxylate synthase
MTQETVQLHYDIHPGNGPYLLMLHGFLASRAQWQSNVTALAQVSQPVVVELLGHGRSPSPQAADAYHPDAYVAAFERIREQLGMERWLLCGQSVGGALTLRYALTHPERVIAQVFTNSNSGLADAEWAANRRLTARKQAAAIEQGGDAGLEKLPVHPIHARRLPAEAKQALLADAKLHNPYGIAQTLYHTTPNSSVRDRLQHLQPPTLLVHGTREKRFADKRQFAEQTIPELQVVEVNAGHAVNIEAPDSFNCAVLDFIRQF